MTIGTNLKKLREKKGLGQQEVCDAIGISQGTLSNYEKGRRVPNPDMIKAFATFYGVSSGSIIGDNQVFGFGDAFENERKKLNYSVADIANILDASEDDIHLFEGNLDSLSIQDAKRYAEFLNKPIDELYKESNSRNTSVPESYRKNPQEYFNSLSSVVYNTPKNSNANKVIELNERDKREITKIIENTKEQLTSADGLLFDGEPVSKDSVDDLLDLIEAGMKIIKKRNKEKYTPKKYRK